MSYSPLFQVMLVLQNNPEGMALGWLYNTALFDADTIGRMAQCFTTLLTQIVQDPSQTFHQLSLVDAQQQQILNGFNQALKHYPIEHTIDQRFTIAAQQYLSGVMF